jgi:hypothetical protein
MKNQLSFVGKEAKEGGREKELYVLTPTHYVCCWMLIVSCVMLLSHVAVFCLCANKLN